MIRTRRLLRPLPLLLVVLSGCSAKGEFPSLAPRPIELGTAAQPAPVQSLAPSDAARVARLDAAVREAEGGVAAFEAALSKARTVVAASDGMRGSERWIAAQMAVSQLERTRAPAQSALAELDSEQRLLLSAPPSVDRAALDAAIARVERINEGQHAAVRPLLSALTAR